MEERSKAMKKLLALILLITICLFAVACGDGEDTSDISVEVNYNVTVLFLRTSNFAVKLLFNLESKLFNGLSRSEMLTVDTS